MNDGPFRVEIEVVPGAVDRIEAVQCILDTVGVAAKTLGTENAYITLLLAVAVAENQITAAPQSTGQALAGLRKLVAAAATRCGKDATAMDLLTEIHVHAHT